jgi:voltage-gated potassium channel
MIDKLNNHFIVCGYGRVGRSAAQQLQRANEPFVVADVDPAQVEAATKRGILAVVADAKSDETLEELGIAQARGLIGALKSDADNLFVILSARTLNPKLRISSRANERGAEAKLTTAGADAVSRPYDITGYRLAQSILRPYVTEFLDLTSSDVDLGHADIEIEQIRVSKGAELSGLCLKDMQLRREMDVIVLAVRRRDGEMRFNPPADAVIDGGDDLVVIGSPSDLQKLERRMKGTSG